MTEFELEAQSTVEIAPKRSYRRSIERRRDIMEAVVTLLSEPRQRRFTIKEIATELDVSEASLYRHYESKAAILLSIIEFCDQSFTSMCSGIDATSGLSMVERAMAKMQAFLCFAKANPGITRIMTTEALMDETPEVLRSMRQVLAKAENSMKQSLKLAITSREIAADTNVAMHANLMMSCVQGRWQRYTQSGFSVEPDEGFLTMKSLFTMLPTPR